MGKVKDWSFPILIIAIGIFLAYRNYTPGTFLIGWDSLHPEFNFGLAFERIFSGVWREEQGVGAIAAHAHMADLPRVLFLWLSSFFIQTSFLRYSYIFLCLVLGPLGVYFFLKYVFEQEREGLTVKIASFLGALYYLLNLGTLQHFFVPFEMFNTQYAFLPWLFLYILKILREEKRKNYLLLFLISFFALPMAYAPALFYAYLGGAFVFIFFYLLFSKFRKILIKRAIVIFSLIFSVNSFWILPNLYSIVNQSKTISNAKINLLFSPEAFIRNESYGTIKDVLIHKNFLFDWRAFDFNSNTFVDLMDVWNKHLATQNILVIGYALAGISMLGLFISVIQRNKVGIVLFFVGVFCLFFLLNTNYQTGFVYKYLYDNFPLFKEGFRLPFTKFSILFMFAMSYFFGYFFFKAKTLSIPLLIPAVLLLTIFMLPAFERNLVSPIVRRNLPSEYKDVFNWFEDKEGRAATLPMQTLWGWDYHNWMYEGSGFAPFGVENPILQRDYDRWSSSNESFYGEASFALYANDQEAFIRTLKKYQVKYLLLDESMINAGGDSKLLYIPQIKSTLSGFKKSASFGFLNVYETNFGSSVVSAPESLIKVNADMTNNQIDSIYGKFGDYYQDVGGVSFPFSNFDRRYGGMEVKLASGRIVLENKRQNLSVIVPSGDKITENFSDKRGFPDAYNCDLKKVGKVFKENLGQEILYRAEVGGVSCDFFTYENLSYRNTYVLRVVGENKEGRGLKIYLQNFSTGKMDIEELLPQGKFDEFFFVLPKKTEGSGYSLNLETRSFGKVASENILQKIEFYPIPFEWLVNYNIGTPQIVSNNLKIESIAKFGTFFYRVNTRGEGLFVLGQGYDDGWISLGLKHLKVNSWANGWIVPQGRSEVIIFFWPQLLQYLGFVLGVSALLILTRQKKEYRI